MSEDESYDPFEDPTMFRAPIFAYDTAEDILRKLMDQGLIDEFRVDRPKINKSEYMLGGLTSARGVRLGEPNKAGKQTPWFTVHVESLPAETFAGLMEGNPYASLLTRLLEKMRNPNVFALIGDGRHWVMWLERDAGGAMNPELSLGPEILDMVVLDSLKEGASIWRREPRFTDVRQVLQDIERVPGLQLLNAPNEKGIPDSCTVQASVLWDEALGWAMQSHLAGKKGVECEIEVFIQTSYRDDVALRLAHWIPISREAAYVSGDGWAVRISILDGASEWYEVNEATMVAAMVAHKLGGKFSTDK